jgi:hypothetical protein
MGRGSLVYGWANPSGLDLTADQVVLGDKVLFERSRAALDDETTYVMHMYSGAVEYRDAGGRTIKSDLPLVPDPLRSAHMSDAFTTTATPNAERSRQRGPVATEAFVPATAGASRAVKVTAVSPIPPFFLMAHPERWAILRGKLRPVLGRLKLVPGVSGVERTRKGLTKVALARAHYEERGWQILPHTVLPPSQAARGSYICRPAGRPDVHLCYWQQVFGGSSAMRADLEMQDEFLDWLTDGDVIQPPEAVVVEKLLQQKRGEYEKAADKGQTDPSVQGQGCVHRR